jgi:uncharacterized protein
MGDISAEPSMEEILSSIKRIIAEEGDAATAGRARRTRPPAAPQRGETPERATEEVLELSQPVAPLTAAAPIEASGDGDAAAVLSPAAASGAAASRPDPILSDRTAEATRGPLEALSRMIVKPETAGSDTLEGLVRELLKPMLRDWLDSNLPRIVEELVAREIARITSRH